MTDSSDIKCRNCGKPNLKVYEDGSGHCLDCDDTFANINDYGVKEPIQKSQVNIYSKKDDPDTKKKWKNPFKDSSILTNIYFLFGLLFLIQGIRFIAMFGGFYPIDFLYLICGILFFITGFSLNENEFMRAFYLSIVISLILLFFGLYELYMGSFGVDITCLCPISFLLFIVFSAFLALRYDKNKRQPKK